MTTTTEKRAKLESASSGAAQDTASTIPSGGVCSPSPQSAMGNDVVASATAPEPPAPHVRLQEHHLLEREITAAVKRWWPRLINRIRRHNINSQDAQDVAQDTFVRLLERDKDLSDLSGGLPNTIADGKVVDLVRRARRWQAREPKLVRVCAMEGQEMTESCLMHALNKLPKERYHEAEAFIRHEICGETLEEIAEQAGVAVSTVRKRIASFLTWCEELQQGEEKA